MKLKVFKKIDLDRLTNEEKDRLKVADSYVQHHGVPMTRRQLLASGLKVGATSMFMPSLVSLLGKSLPAHAQACAATKNLPAAVVLNLAGGYSVAGNFVFMGQDGNFISSYSRLGLGTPGNFGVDSTFGEASGNFSNISQLLAGIIANASPMTLANTSVLGIACQSQDDTANNELNATGMFAEVLKGDFLPVLGQNRNTPAILASPAPLNIGGHNDIENAISVQGSIGQMSDASKTALFNTITNLTTLQGRKLASLSGGEALAQLSNQASQTNEELVSGTGNVDINPLNDQAFSTVWGINANNINNQVGGDASAVYNALKGNATMVNISRGGYDYHGNPRATTDGRDNDAGIIVGRCLESAAVLRKKLFLMITTDGSVASQDSSTPGAQFTSDSGGRSGTICFFFDPDKKPTQTKRQLGHFTDGQAAATNTAVGGAPSRGVAAAIVNYLTFAGRQDLVEKVTRGTFSSQELEEIMAVFS